MIEESTVLDYVIARQRGRTQLRKVSGETKGDRVRLASAENLVLADLCSQSAFKIKYRKSSVKSPSQLPANFARNSSKSFVYNMNRRVPKNDP